MKFDKEHKVIIHTMTKEQAIAFNIFLDTEILRHQEDIDAAEKKKADVKHWFGIE